MIAEIYKEKQDSCRTRRGFFVANSITNIHFDTAENKRSFAAAVVAALAAAPNALVATVTVDSVPQKPIS